MTKRTIIAGFAAAVAFLAATAAQAIGNGTLDGDAHPNVGMLAIGDEETKYALCSGSYAGAKKDDASMGVFLTAGHCVAWMPGEGVFPSQLWVTFDTAATWDEETGEAVGATTWYQATDFAFDPATGLDRANLKDYAVVVLESTALVEPVDLPEAGELDIMAARGGLRPGALFDNVGYGVIPVFKQGRPHGVAPPGRMVSTSSFQSLTKAYLTLLMTEETRHGENGGVCFGDSGSPHFLAGTNTAVALTSGGDAICRATNRNQRLDVPDARAFLGQFVDLP